MQWLRISILAAGVVFLRLQAVTVQDCGLDSAKPEISVPKTEREYKRLRTRAHTPGDFKALAEWCDLQAADCRAKQLRCETDLSEYYEHPLVPPAKFPRRDQALNLQIASYKKQADHWKELASGYSSKAEAVANSSQDK